MGVWHLPYTLREARKLANLMKRPITGRDVDNHAVPIGDDGLCDVASERPNGDLRWLIATMLRDWDEAYIDDPSTFKVKFQHGAWDVLRSAYLKILNSPHHRSLHQKAVRSNKARRRHNARKQHLRGRAVKYRTRPTAKSTRRWSKGSMHRALGVPKGKKIPTAKLVRAALFRKGVVAERARFLLNLRGVKTGTF